MSMMLIDLVVKHPDKCWNYYGLTSNESFSIDDLIHKYHKLFIEKDHWNIIFINRHKLITIDMMLDKNFPYNSRGASANPNITWKIMQLYPFGLKPGYEWDSSGASENPNITLDIILKHPYGPKNDSQWRWNMDKYSKNRNIKIKDVMEYWPAIRWNWISLSANHSISIEDIMNNNSLPWNWEIVSQRYDLTWNIIKENNFCPNAHHKWTWYYIGMKETVTWDIVIEYKSLPWDWNGISCNPNINLDIIKKYPTNSLGDEVPLWNWHGVSRNSSVTFEMILDNPNDSFEFGAPMWYWLGVSSNPNISPDIIDKYCDLQWSWDVISFNHMINNKRMIAANKFANTIKDDLHFAVFHPSRHPAAYLPTCDMKDHPLEFVTQKEVTEMYRDLQIINKNK